MEENSYESRSIVSNLKGNKTNVYDFDRVSLFFYNLDFPIFRRVCVCVRHIYTSYQRLKLEFYDFLIEKRVHEISFKIVG